MKFRTIFAIILVAGLIVSLPKVNAHTWDQTAINSGYGITTNWHGIDVPGFVEVTARAGTTNPDITEVKFRWLRPGGSEAWIVPTTLDHTDTWNGQTVYVFMNSQIPDTLGDWGVQAVFYDSEGNGVGPIPAQPEPIAIRAQSFNVIPEVPFGTMVVLLSMFGALGVFALKKKRIPASQSPT